MTFGYETLSPVDNWIIVFYFVLIISFGIYFSKRASKGISSYFLGNREVPWWAIGMSGTASNFDMTGTMVIISFFFAIGLQGFWVSMRGGVGLPLGILMILMGKWLRRSNVMTTAEWMELRFGRGTQGNLARILSAVSNIVVTMAFLVYFVKGTGKFLSIFLPFSPTTCSLIMMAIAVVYTALSGFYGVIWTDVLQELLIIGVAVFVGYKAFTLENLPEIISSSGSSWASFIPEWNAGPMNWLDNPYIYQGFGLCIIFWVARGIFEGMGGFTGGYMTQRYYATRNDRESSLLTAEWIILLFFRWSLIIGIVLIGKSIASESAEIMELLKTDPEKTLPVVLSLAIPAGLRGILIAGLIAAAMSTFDSTINAGVSYWVRDIYQRFLKPKASRKQLMRQSYGATIILALLAVISSMLVSNINEIWSWITGPLSAGLFAPIILRWYWWRFNGYGFALSTAGGLLASLLIKIIYPEMEFSLSFIITWVISLASGILGSLLTEETALETLQIFWERIRPFGFWKPVKKTIDGKKTQSARIENSRDIKNIPIAILWHMSGVVSVISLILHKWDTLTGALSLFTILTITLYFTWYKNLQSKEDAKRESMECIDETTA